MLILGLCLFIISCFSGYMFYDTITTKQDIGWQATCLMMTMLFSFGSGFFLGEWLFNGK